MALGSASPGLSLLELKITPLDEVFYTSRGVTPHVGLHIQGQEPKAGGTSIISLLTNAAFSPDQPECQIKVLFICLCSSPLLFFSFLFYFFKALMGVFNDETAAI